MNYDKLKEFLEFYYDEDEKTSLKSLKVNPQYFYMGICMPKHMFVERFIAKFGDIVDRFLEKEADQMINEEDAYYLQGEQ